MRTFSAPEIQRGALAFTWRGIPCLKDPFDFALYSLLLGKLRPRTIIEIGSYMGGSALCLSDLAWSQGVGSRVISIDIKLPTSHLNGPEFRQGNGRDLAAVVPDIRTLDHPILVIDDADHLPPTTTAILRWCNENLLVGDKVVVEDTITEQLYPGAYSGGPEVAVEEFLNTHYGWTIDREMQDFFGPDATWNTYLMRTGAT